MATNKINNKVYIGQTIRTLKERKAQHVRDTKKGSELPFHCAIRKYSEENFTWETVYRTDNLQDLNEAEEYLIAEYNSRGKGYNVMYGGENRRMPPDIRRKISASLRGHTVSDKTREAVIKANAARVYSDEARRKLSARTSGEKNGNFGRTLSAEARGRISAANKGRTPSAETLEKLSKATAGEKNPAYNPTVYAFAHKNHGIVSSTQYHLRKQFGVNINSLRAVVSGHRKTTGGWSLVNN